MANGNQHVVPHGDGWAVQGERGTGSISVFETKQEAIDRGREMARRSGSELLVHGRSGQIFRSADAPGSLDERVVREVVRDFAVPASPHEAEAALSRGRDRQCG